MRTHPRSGGSCRGRLGSIFVVLAVLGLIGFEGRSIWLQVAISWVLFSAVIRWIGFLIGSNSVR